MHLFFTKEHFQYCDDGHTCQFHTAENDALLVVPENHKSIALADAKIYSHLAAFLRGAPPEQIKETWNKVAFLYYDLIQMRGAYEPVWLNTAGDATMPWLHFRLDDKPKYYKYKPFAKVAATSG